MLKSVEKLVQAVRYGKKKATCGNHWMEVKDDVIKYYYHNTEVCIVNKIGQVEYHNGNWNTSSTTRCIHSYMEIYGKGEIKE